MAPCGICTDVKNTRYLDIYVMGSEGLNICHECEMRLVTYIREMKSLVATAKMLGVKIGRQRGL
jgi:hypothetical protein